MKPNTKAALSVVLGVCVLSAARELRMRAYLCVVNR
jgi:hypothetical protein